MTTIFERVETALSTLAGITHAMGRLVTSTGAELPNQYVVYSVISAGSSEHYDDAETSRDYVVQVTTFSRAGLVSLPNVDAAMKAAGFTKNAGRQLPKDAQTGHYGWAQDYTYHEEI